MKKFLALALILGMANMASAAIVLDIMIDGREWDGEGFAPTQIISLRLSHDGPLAGGMLNSNLNVSRGDGASGTFTTDPATGWLLAGGKIRPAESGFDVFFNGAVFFPREPNDIGHVDFHIPDMEMSSYMVIDANGGLWDGVEAVPGYDDGLPFAMLHMIAEPMTMTLLGLGGLALIRRRHTCGKLIDSV